MKAEIAIPVGYRRLKPGEGFKPGDWCLSFPDMFWYRHECRCSECDRPVPSKEVIPDTPNLLNGFFAIRRIKTAKPTKKRRSP